MNEETSKFRTAKEIQDSNEAKRYPLGRVTRFEGHLGRHKEESFEAYKLRQRREAMKETLRSKGRVIHNSRVQGTRRVEDE